MTIVYGGLAWLVGMFAAAFLLAPPVIILVFGVPFALELKRKGVLTSAAPAVRLVVSFFLLLAEFGLVSWAVWHFFPKCMWVYAVGVGLTLLPGLRKCGRTEANMKDFFDSNTEYINKEALAAWRNEANLH